MLVGSMLKYDLLYLVSVKFLFRLHNKNFEISSKNSMHNLTSYPPTFHIIELFNLSLVFLSQFVSD